MSDNSFIERRHINEKEEAIAYVKELIKKAQKESRESDIHKLEKLIQIIDTKKYGLVWEEHSEKVEEEMQFKIPVFTENQEKKINSSSDTDKFNFLLEGDNLHSLHLLEKTHLGKIDVIYIDPPYNTGNKDFKYNDRFVREDDSFKHSMWLSFMSNRLKLAKKLLKEDGVIFVSIGDEEFAQLKLLMDDVFGENSFKESLMIELSATTGNKVAAAKKGGLVKNGEYILVYSASDFTNTNRQPLFDLVPGFDTHFSLFLNDDGSIEKTIDVLKNNLDLVKEFGRLADPKERFTLKSFAKYFDQSPVFSEFAKKNVARLARSRNEVPKIPEDVIAKLSEDNWIKYISDKRSDPYYLTIANNMPINLATMEPTYHWTDDFKPVFGRSTTRGDFWKGFWIDMGNIGKEGGVSLKNGKKPVRLIKQLLKWANRPNGIVLDFFAGSGTTGEAVLELNSEDKGKREFILATNDEVINTTYKRMQNINKKVPMNLKYYKTNFVVKEKFPNVFLEYELLRYVTPLVELEFGLDINNPKVQIVLSEEQLETLINNNQLISNSTLFMHPDIFIDQKQNQVLRELQIEIQEIPNYFFGSELWIK
ncbi:site-specific DNA-methyltransferase [Fructobacillus sp. M1-13]|uniref:Site-specific DNA-methyltransferase n=1 Tax=Fructobacillus papyriferae TaxID=2713171 RepID=A0ABS5QPL6_9LACO|nr:site-specific DNA-methyltransferase [Fructobacillus papyriferae]MBS9334837.1 site-specific DNA-methyltransferase [Fructobacillus papyriferae]MCD2158827.1 site-specific DNA-methyltransferase [Fructobacillus papyriferae]